MEEGFPVQEHVVTLTYIGGPTALLELGGLRLLTDPTFDLPGVEYKTGPVTLHKLQGPALTPKTLGHIDAVLLSHDQHFDNLDRAGRHLLETVERVFTTQEGAARLKQNAFGLAAWQTENLTASDGTILRVTGTPARHGAEGADLGPVTGFVLSFHDSPEYALYISGDSVWFEGIAEVARRFDVHTAILSMGAARVPAVGNHHLTMTAAEGLEAARVFPNATILPLHFEGWAHLSESREIIAETFAKTGLATRLRWPEAGKMIRID